MSKKIIKKKSVRKIIKPRFDPTDREIIRVLKPLRMRVTPFKIASTIKVHPATVQRRLVILEKAKLINSIKRGNRTYTQFGVKKRLLKKRR